MIDLHKGIPERKFRNELKYVCSQGELEIIRSRIRVLCPPDPHAGPTGIYNIRSIYFDDLDNRCYYESTMLLTAVFPWSASGRNIL